MADSSDITLTGVGSPSIAGVSLPANSRYLATYLYYGGGYTFFGPSGYPQIPPDPSDIVFNAKEYHLGRLDLVSFEIYGKAQWWWVIALANNIVDPFRFPKPGDILIAPQESRIIQLLQGA